MIATWRLAPGANHVDLRPGCCRRTPGYLKKEIALIGDTMNAAARIVEACRETENRVLASAALLDRLAALPPGVTPAQAGRACPCAARSVRWSSPRSRLTGIGALNLPGPSGDGCLLPALSGRTVRDTGPAARHPFRPSKRRVRRRRISCSWQGFSRRIGGFLFLSSYVGDLSLAKRRRPQLARLTSSQTLQDGDSADQRGCSRQSLLPNRRLQTPLNLSRASVCSAESEQRGSK